MVRSIWDDLGLHRYRTALVLCLYAAGLFAQGSSSVQEKYNAAQKALEQGEFKRAQALYLELAASDPQIAEIHANLGLIYFQEQKFEDAAKELRRALQLKPSLNKTRTILAMALSELGQFAEAVSGLESGFHSEDSDIQRLCGLQLLRTYTALHRDADAVSTALTLNRLYPTDPEILYHTGRIYGNYAYITMEKLHDSAPDSVWMLQAQGEANESQKDYEAAIIAFRHVLALQPNRPGIHYRLGRIFLSRYGDSRKVDDRSAAVNEFEAELQTDPNNGNALYELARLAAEDNNLEKAREFYQSLVRHSPGFEEAWVGLAGVYLETKSSADAVTALNTAVKLAPVDEVAWYRLSEAQRAVGNRQGAAEALDMFRSIHAAPSKARRPIDDVTPQRLDVASAP